MTNNEILFINLIVRSSGDCITSPWTESERTSLALGYLWQGFHDERGPGDRPPSNRCRGPSEVERFRRLLTIPSGSSEMTDSETGIVLVAVGVVMMFTGIFFWPLCGVGILLIIIGAIVAAASEPRARYYYPAPYGYPPVPPDAAGPAPAGPAPFAAPACPVCGTPTIWVAQYGRWYCARCQAYR